MNTAGFTIQPKETGGGGEVGVQGAEDKKVEKSKNINHFYLIWNFRNLSLTTV